MLFLRPYVTVPSAVFNRCAMHGFASTVLSCQERARLEGELFQGTHRERVFVPVAARLAEHEVAHGRGR